MDKKCRSGAAGIKRSLIQNMGKRSFLEKTSFPCFKYARARAYFCRPAKFLAKKNVATSKQQLKISPPPFFIRRKALLCITCGFLNKLLEIIKSFLYMES
jgi:hypothetical protein